MTDIIVKIMVEVLSILGIITKEIQQGRMSMFLHTGLFANINRLAEKYLSRLAGRKGPHLSEYNHSVSASLILILPKVLFLFTRTISLFTL